MFTHVKSWCTNFSNLGPSLWDGNGRDKSHLPPHLHYSAMPFGKALACCPFESSSGWKRAGWGILKCISNAMKAGPGHPWQRGNGAEMLSLQMERSPQLYHHHTVWFFGLISFTLLFMFFFLLVLVVETKARVFWCIMITIYPHKLADTRGRATNSMIALKVASSPCFSL